jgi:hypothetical protein
LDGNRRGFLGPTYYTLKKRLQKFQAEKKERKKQTNKQTKIITRVTETIQ